MSHSFVNALLHCTLSTKERRRLIAPDLQSRLWPYMGGIARDNGMKAIIVGGVEDHVHALLSLPATMAIAKAIQLIKCGSSKWVHETFSERSLFAWQEGYGAFSIGIAQVDATVEYIRTQAEHHGRMSFQEEFLRFLKKHGIEYDERFLLG